MRFAPLTLIGLLACSLLSSCVMFENEQQKAHRIEQERLAAIRVETTAAHAAFRAEKGWKSKTYKSDAVLATLTLENVSIQVSLDDQRALLMNEDLIAIDFPIASGRSSYPTPKGTYKIKEKALKHNSNQYGKVYDAAGVVVEGDATSGTVIPEGGSFQGASMPYWMRLTDTGVGLHIGYVPGHPASHGCIRMPRKVAPEIYSKVKIGTPVLVTAHAPVAWPWPAQ